MLTETESKRLETLQRIVRTAHLRYAGQVNPILELVRQRHGCEDTVCGPYHRYVLVTEGAGEFWTEFHESLAELRESAVTQLRDAYTWFPRLAADLDTGQTYQLHLDVVIEGALTEVLQ